jgi:predicted MFS family arabinose efflux permease
LSLLERKPENTMTSPQETARTRTLTGRITTFESFTVPAFRFYYASMGGTWLALYILMIVRTLLIFRLSGSTAAAGGLVLANGVSMLLMSVFGGALGDRVEKRRLMLVGCASLTVVAFVVAALLSSDYLGPKRPGSWWILTASAVFEGGIFGLLLPISTSILPELVGINKVMNAIFLGTTGMNICRLIGPAAAGYLVDKAGFAVVYYVMSALYAMAAIFALFLPHTGLALKERGTAFSDILKGFSYLRRETTILLIILFTVCAILAGQPFFQLFPVVTESVLKVSASKMGFLTGLSGLGALAGSLLLASVPFRRRGAILLWSGILMGFPIMMFTYAHQWWISVACMCIVGMGVTTHMGLTSTLVQTYAEVDYRSRMQSLLSAANGLAGFGTFTTALLAESIGIQTSIGLTAAFLTLVSGALIVFARSLRRMK